jgi:NAD(P)-dependent dehydrogenase (short-subunit alcohol dehydrogenase family)
VPTHLITGAGSGIGAALTDALHARGDSLVLVARSPERADELGSRWDGARTLVADLADAASFAGLDLPDSLDSVVHAAGVVDLGAVGELTAEQWREHMDVNLVAPAVLTRLALPSLRAGRGTVVFVNSGAGLRANPQWAAYAASKHGLRALADSLRAEEQEHGVRVTSVYPGRTATPMQEWVHDQEGKEYDAGEWIRPETVADTILHVLDLPRDATVPDVTVSPGH